MAELLLPCLGLSWCHKNRIEKARMERGQRGRLEGRLRLVELHGSQSGMLDRGSGGGLGGWLWREVEVK